MNYQETLNFLFSQLPMYQRDGQAAYKADLNNTIEFDVYFDSPHKNFKTIHVAGTNGKGSVSHMLASILQESGYRTGLYTSPHLKDFRERIKINGLPIREEDVVHFVSENKAKIEEIEPSFFEMTVAMAFDYFSREKVDIAIIEVGMGGRLDSTNIIQPLVSVITNIGLDHTQFLGDTIEKVAFEKAGIIKENTPIVIGEYQQESFPVFKKIAKEKESRLILAEDNFQIDYAMYNFEFKQLFNVKQSGIVKYKDLKLDLLGIYQKMNLITVLSTIEELNGIGFGISAEDIYGGLNQVVSHTGLLGRWQVLNPEPLIICDTGHNEDGLKQVLNQISQTPYKKLHFILGLVNDKNIDKVLSMLPKAAEYYFVQAKIPRALDKEILFEKAKQIGLSGEMYESVLSALESAKNKADKQDLIFVGGSTFVVAEVV